jgi:hypothetical protein
MISAADAPFNGNAQAALNALMALGGGQLYLPAGQYGTLSAEFASIPNAKVTISGDGAATRIAGLRLRKAAYLHVSDLAIEGAAIGLDCQDIEQSLFERVNVRWCQSAGQFLGGTQTDPNSLTFIDCAFANNSAAGLTIEHPNAVTFIGGSIQYNEAFGLKLKNPGSGYATVSLIGLALEGNKGAGDLVCEGTGLLMLTVSGSSFLRTALGFGANNVKMECGHLRLEGVTFRGMAGYTPDAARPYLDLGATEIDAGQVHFDHAVESPSWAGKQLSSRQGAVWGRKSPIGAYTWSVGIDKNFYVAGPFSMSSGVVFGAINDANTTLQPMEFRASEVMFTGTTRFGQFTGSSDTPVIGYVQIKDASGALRKLAVIA